MVLVSTIGGGIVVPTKDGGSWILLFPRPIAVAAGCYTWKTTKIGRHFLPPATTNAERTMCDRHFGVVVPVRRSRFGRRVFHGSICFPGFRRLVSTKKTIPGPPDGDNAAAAANVGDAEHQRTWCAGFDYQCPLRCGILLVNFGILP